MLNSTTKLPWYYKTFVYGCIGLIIEVIFTALANPSTFMVGYTYLWMFFVWAFGVHTLEFMKSKIDGVHIIFRTAAYVTVCFIIEYTFGMFFKYMLGGIPWDYSYSPYNLGGAIRIDYAPYWALAGLFSEYLTKFMNKITISEQL